MVSVDPSPLSAKDGLLCTASTKKCNSEVALSISYVSIEKENPVSLSMKHLQLHVEVRGSPERDFLSLRAFGPGGFSYAGNCYWTRRVYF